MKSLIADHRCDVVILDFDSRYSSVEQQLELFDQIRHWPIPVLAMTDDDRRSTAIELVSRGVYDYFRKPPALQELKIILRRAHEHALMKRELATLQRRLAAPDAAEAPCCDQLIGASTPSRVLYDLIHRVGNVNAHVLITGESGTGKELIARAIHNLSNRAGLPFVSVSCGAIPETLIEAELFGHEKGAFTGAAAARAGYLEQAGGGTLLLDEIGELTLSTQVKLLRLLQQREFCRLGSGRPLTLRARVLFATHRDLAQMVQQGTFRQDLFFRVNVMRIHSPALRDRAEDIPALAWHFLRVYSELYEKLVLTIEEDALAILREYSWPGNVRELENAIQSAIVMTKGHSIGPEDLLAALQEVVPLSFEECAAPGSFEDQLKDYRVRLAVNAVREANGNKSTAARSLNISRAYLHRLIREAGEDVPVL